MKKAGLLTIIGILAGIVLLLMLKLVLLTTGNTAYILLFNFDYVPIVNTLKPVWFFGYVFHFFTCVVSVIALFYILKKWHLQFRILPYILVYGVGGGALFFLTALSDQPPASNDWVAWIYWTLAHGIYGYVVGWLVKKWMR